jgi:hypothetical protein
MDDKYDPQYLMVSQTTFGNFHTSDSISITRFTATMIHGENIHIFFFAFTIQLFTKRVS